MAQQQINLGSAPNDDTGDDLRAGGDKINDNFTELYDHANSTNNPHSVTKNQVSLGNVANSLQVINAGDVVSIQAGAYSSRPSAGTAGRYYLATDTGQLFRDNGTNWILENVRKTADANSSPYNADETDHYIGVTTVPHTVNLPASGDLQDGHEVVVKDESGQASMNGITISADGGNPDTIDGAMQRIINVSHGAVTLKLRGSNWNIISSHLDVAPS